MSFIGAAQLVGLSLADIREALSSLPAGRTPTARDWARLARGWRPLLDERIAMLTAYDFPGLAESTQPDYPAVPSVIS